ncbi:hypothetical protein CALVIDRAFT_561252 [Calocera viscosa TUFC12733]|uniref:Uncharacterized protein n=1 Tax=Calocera viscosa (strain TUFC12733) TaxID=1330018 RepID=A0A167Q421_CALVF|nr:hypothetical protein CALVIDRAFT_561252 [Calocera viscosa TUFC12733]
MYPGASPLPPYFTFLQARLQMVRDDWAAKTAPGSPFLSSLNILANALRASSLLLALALLSGILSSAPGVLPLLRGLAFLQLLAAASHTALSRWAHHKTRARTALSLAVLLAYGAVSLLVQQAVLLSCPDEPRLQLLLEVVRFQGWHIALDVADISPPRETCNARPSLLVSF